MSGTDRMKDGVAGPLVMAVIAMGAVAAGFGAWMWMAPVSSAVVAEGRFKVAGDVKTVQHLEGGIVSGLMVSDGDRVRKGDLLVELDATEAEASRASLLAERDALMARKARLEAELSGATEVDFGDLARSERPSARTAVASQATLFRARTEERLAQDQMLDGTLARLSTRLDAQRAELDSVGLQRELVKEVAESANSLAGSGLVTQINLNSRKRDLVALDGAGASLTAGIAETEAAQGEARLSHAQKRSQFTSAVSNELSQVVSALAEIAPRIATEDGRIRRAKILAPLDGAVVGQTLATIGGVVSPGQPIMDIVPAGGTLIAEARLAPAARERLHVGLPVELRLPGVRSRKEQGIDGEITLISAEPTDDPDIAGDEDEPTYAVTIALADIPDDMRLEPGMPVTSVIAMQSRTAIDYLVSPITDAMARSMREE